MLFRKQVDIEDNGVAVKIMDTLPDLLKVLDLNAKLKSLTIEGRTYKYFDLSEIPQIHKLPYCLRILLESCLRQSLKDETLSEVWITSAQDILEQNTGHEVLFQPGRVVLQDFTGVAALVDLAAMRDLAHQKGQNPLKIDSKCPADLVVDHSVQVDFSQVEKLLQKQHREVEAAQAAQAAAVASQPPVLPTTFYTEPQSGEVYYYPVPPDLQYVQGAQALPPTPALVPSNPVPSDNPGLPIQDEVCPFHQRMSYWAETLQKNRRSEMEKNDERFKVKLYNPDTGSKWV